MRKTRPTTLQPTTYYNLLQLTTTYYNLLLYRIIPYYTVLCCDDMSLDKIEIFIFISDTSYYRFIMVKNTVGGSKTKGFARKSYQKTSSTVRTPNNPLELFAIVTKLYGQGRCQVITYTGTLSHLTLNCVIRNKFKARFKNMNLVSIHSIILVGLRDWEAPDFKICDLLEVYSQDDIHHLRNIPHLSYILSSLDLTRDNNNNNTHPTHPTHPTHDFEFSNNTTTTNNNNNNNNNTHFTIHDDNEFIPNDFDDI